MNVKQTADACVPSRKRGRASRDADLDEDVDVDIPPTADGSCREAAVPAWKTALKDGSRFAIPLVPEPPIPLVPEPPTAAEPAAAGIERKSPAAGSIRESACRPAEGNGHATGNGISSESAVAGSVAGAGQSSAAGDRIGALGHEPAASSDGAGTSAGAPVAWNYPTTFAERQQYYVFKDLHSRG